ncbi:MAG: DUF763 domain-containing protein [Bacteroidota bacterium]
MKRSGTADMALWGGSIPTWLFERMVKLSLPIVESILMDYGREGFVRRLSDPYWFQSFGAVIGMDWNSSGVTTAIMRALKQAINPHGPQLGLYICGGKGKQSLKTPAELIRIGDFTGLDGNDLSRSSKLSAKVDNTAVQDGFSLYLHSFVLSTEGHWSVIQQGMDGKEGLARRYHWHSGTIDSFVEEPHAAVCGDNQGMILNLVSKDARKTQEAILAISQEKPEKLLKDIPKLQLPGYCDLKAEDIDLKRLGGVLRVAQEQEVKEFDEFLLQKGLGPRTLQALTLVSEVIHGTPSRFADPARFSFAHGGKSAKPFAVPTKVYDESISVLQKTVERAKIGQTDKQKALQKLSKLAQRAEADAKADLDQALSEERQNFEKHGGRLPERKKRSPKE